VSDAAPYRYAAYGIRLASALSLPGLTPDTSPEVPDAVLRVGAVRGEATRPVRTGCFDAGPGVAWVALEGTAVLRVRGGSEITVEPDPDADPRLVQTFVLGTALAILLGQRGRLVLHASAVALPTGHAVAFAGEKGWGKSTAAAALVGRGGALVTDDLLVLDLTGPRAPRALPGTAEAKLWPDAVETLAASGAPLPRVFGASEKRRWAASRVATGEAVPLAALYVLGRGEAVAAARLAPHEAVAEVVRHSFLRGLLRPTGLDVEHLGQVGAVARQTPVFRLTRPHALDGVAAVAAFVEAHVGTLPSCPATG
jgi:hypothetical protein